MTTVPPPLPPQGFLLESLGYLEEPLAAIALDIRLPTLIEYRKKQIGPDFAVVGRTILYSRANLQKWLENGGTRAFAGHEPVLKADAVIERATARKPKPVLKRKGAASPRTVADAMVASMPAAAPTPAAPPYKHQRARTRPRERVPDKETAAL